MRNTGGLPADLTGWQLVTPAGAFPMPSVVVPVAGIALLHPARAGSSVYPDVFLPAVPDLANSATLALFRSAATGSAADPGLGRLPRPPLNQRDRLTAAGPSA